MNLTQFRERIERDEGRVVSSDTLKTGHLVKALYPVLAEVTDFEGNFEIEKRAQALLNDWEPFLCLFDTYGDLDLEIGVRADNGSEEDRNYARLVNQFADWCNEEHPDPVMLEALHARNLEGNYGPMNKWYEEYLEMSLNEDAFWVLGDMAPEGYTFGASMGDGACFGFWKVEEEPF